MPTRYEGSGETSREGKLYIYNRAALNQFFKDNPGKRVAFTFQIFDKDISKGQRGYFFGEIVPRFMDFLIEQGNDVTDEQARNALEDAAPIMWKQIHLEGGKTVRTRRRQSDEDFSGEDMSTLIDFCIRYLLEEFNLALEEPRK
jgi:hypothetical protein